MDAPPLPPPPVTARMKFLVKDVLLWLYWHPFRALVRALPVAGVHGLGRLLAWVAVAFMPGKARALVRELEETLRPRGVTGASGVIVRETLLAWLLNELEMFRYPDLNPGNIADYTQLVGEEHLQAGLAAGRGVMLLFAHFGANQMIMPAMGHRGYVMSQLSAPPMAWKEVLGAHRVTTPMWDKALELRWQHELSLPVTHINVFGNLRKAFACLKGNEVLGIAVDGGGGKERVAVGFLGRQALLSTGTVQIALRTRCTVLPTFMVRGVDGCNALVMEAPIPLPEGGDERENARRVLQAFMARMDDYVVKHPSHYLNFLVLRRVMAERGDTPLFS